MMTIFMNVMMVSSLSFMIFSNNPMKTSFFILVSASMMFLSIKMKMGSVWIPLIYFILFTGGILLMFMILASILPNEKAMKVKISKAMVVSLILLTMIQSKESNKETTLNLMKSFMSASFNLIFMTSVILFYFFSSMSINNVEEYPMRSVMCWYSKMIL